MSAAIRRFALGELRFTLVGITDASPLDGGQRLAAWLEAGAHGEMDYLTRTVAVRADPRAFLPGAQSVIVVALSYHERLPVPATPPPDAVRIARYAQRRDYHQVIRARLVRLGHFLADQRPGCRFRVAVDSAPLLEKELAQRAGLGWIGKNTCLVNRSYGSALLLGELVTDLPLSPDPPADDLCGACTACLEACPTAALVRPRYLDARRCIAYLTLEHRSAFPGWAAAAIGRHLAGCDRCQEVCPFTRVAPHSCDAALLARPDLQDPSLACLAGLDESGWRRFTTGTPLRRLSFDRFSRNLQAIAAPVAAGAERAARSLTGPSRRGERPDA